MSVKTNREFDNLMNPELWDRVMGEMARFVLLDMLTVYVPKDFSAPPWNTTLSTAYGKRKVRAGRPPVGDLIVTGALVEATISDAPSNIIVKGATASTTVDSVYAATHQFGDPRRNIPQREFIRFDDHADELVADLEKEFASIVSKT